MDTPSTPRMKSERVSPAQIIILGFLFLILGGALLLTLPIATNGPGGFDGESGL